MPSINKLQVPFAAAPRPSSSARAPRRHRLLRFVFGSAGATAVGVVALHVVLPFPSERLRGREYVHSTRHSPAIAWAAEAQQSRLDSPRSFLALEDLSPWVQIAVVAGIDPLFHEASAWRHVCALVDFDEPTGRSLACEVARALEPEHSLRGGLFDVWRVCQLEQVLTRNEILEEWLDRTDFGGGSIGLQAAARHWFGCAPNELTLGRCALLAALSDPRERLELDLRRTTPCEQRDRVLATLLERGAIDTDHCDAARAEPLHLLDHRALAALAPLAGGSEVSIIESATQDDVPR